MAKFFNEMLGISSQQKNIDRMVQGATASAPSAFETLVGVSRAKIYPLYAKAAQMQREALLRPRPRESHSKFIEK